MARTKTLNLKIAYGSTGFYVNDLGSNKSPRFELYDKPNKKVVQKANNPYEFDEYMEKIWKKANSDENV